MSASLSPDQVAAVLKALGIEPAQASGPVVAQAPAVKATPAWLVARGERKAKRRALAATLRAQGISPSDAEAWAKAKKAAGITRDEAAAHKAFTAKKAN